MMNEFFYLLEMDFSFSNIKKQSGINSNIMFSILTYVIFYLSFFLSYIKSFSKGGHL